MILFVGSSQKLHKDLYGLYSHLGIFRNPSPYIKYKLFQSKLANCHNLVFGPKFLLLKHATTSAIASQAQADGMITMQQDGILKVLTSTTTLQEVARVATD